MCPVRVLADDMLFFVSKRHHCHQVHWASELSQFRFTRLPI